MEAIVRTVYGAALQTSQLLGRPLTLKPYSTLNEKFNIHTDVLLANDDNLFLQYATIGNGGHRMVMGTNGISRPEPIQHLPRHSALYNHLPFVLRLPANDLTALERAKYRLRRLETHDSVQYVAYYGKVLDFTNTVPQLELRSVVDGVTTSTLFEPTVQDMSPTPPPLTPGGVITATGDYIAATAKVPFVMSPEDIVEFLQVCNIIYGDDSYAMISEIGLCSGVDRTVVGDFNGTNAGYTDAIGVQIVSFVSAFFAAKFTNNGISVEFDIGSVEALLNLS